jgi:hypothetical protein
MTSRTPDELTLLGARRERSLHWLRASYALDGYPTLPAEAETPETLAAEPPERVGRR